MESKHRIETKDERVLMRQPTGANFERNARGVRPTVLDQARGVLLDADRQRVAPLAGEGE